MFAAPGTHQNARRFSSKGKSGLEVRASASNAAPVVLAGDVAAASDATAPAGFVWKGAKIVPALLSVALGLIVKFVIPCPAGVLPQAWTLLAIFLSTIAGGAAVEQFASSTPAGGVSLVGGDSNM